LLHIGIEKGATAPVNNVLAIIGEKGEDIQALLADAKKGADAPAETPKEDAAPAEEKKETPEPVKEEKSTPVAKPAPQPVAQTSGDGRIFASPLAKKLAEDKGIDVNRVQGSGENGRIVKRDVENYIPYERPAGGNYSAAPAGTESYRDENVSQMRKVIAKRLAESKFTAPHFYLTLEIDMDNAIVARKAMNAQEGVKVSFNDMVVKAVAMSLRKHPTVNSAWMGDFIRRNDHIHIGVAVAVEDGLLVPVVRFADTKGLSQIGTEVKDFAQKAKDKKLQPQDWEGNTFTISSLELKNLLQLSIRPTVVSWPLEESNKCLLLKMDKLYLVML
jgi:pyruvate dehydrogenase E2 component (dihydrolipoamide acetyltransferase)